MTLLRQLILVIASLFTLLFLGSVVINVKNTRDYLNNQLRTISQDQATSLGVSLSPHLAANEMAIVTSLITAVSDSGYYREIILTDVNGKTLVERIQPTTIEGVPAWFVKLIALETPRGESNISAGWLQAGTIIISANPGYAYVTLWEGSLQALIWFLGASVVVLGIGVVALHFVLRPLKDVELQAIAICDREYPVQTDIPWTLELRSVVSAMNLMSSKVKDMFKEQADAMERLRASTYVDSLTGLANRQYFDLQLKQLTKTRSTASTNALIFIELADFKGFNDRNGYQAGDALLRGCSELIREICHSVPNLDYFIARPSGANFAIVLVDTVDEGAQAVAEKLAASLIKLKTRKMIDSDRVGNIGVAMHRRQDAKQLLTDADAALRIAQEAGPNTMHMNNNKEGDEAGSYPAARWLEILRDVLAKDRISLFRQPCASCKDETKVLQYEALMRIHGDDGKLIPANIVIPMAKHLQLTIDLDKSIVKSTLMRLARPENEKTVMSVNLFPMSTQDSGFISWLSEALKQYPKVAPRIAFEVPEHGVSENLDALQNWVTKVSAMGAKTGLDQVGKGFRSFSYLSNIKLHYIKIDGSYARNIHESRENQFFVDSLVKYAHGLGIQVIAESVENKEEWEMLKTLRVDGVKGYGVAKPAEWN